MLDGLTVGVTGSKGFVGNLLVQKLLEQHAEVIEISRLELSKRTLERNLNTTLHSVVHLAAKTFVPYSFQHPYQFFDNNISATLNALEICKKKSAKLIYASTYVYGNPRFLPISEEHQVNPLNPYSESKVIGENLCKCYSRDFGVKTIILRIFNIFGPNQAQHFLIPKIVEKAKSGVIKLKDPNPKRDFVYVSDVVNAFKKAILYTPEHMEVFNIGSGRSYSVDYIANLVTRLINPKVQGEINYSNEVRQGEIEETVADIDKAKRMLNWEPKVSFEAGVASCIQGAS